MNEIKTKADYMQEIANALGKYTVIAVHHRFFDKYDAVQLMNIIDVIIEICEKEKDGQKKACLLLRDFSSDMLDLSSKTKITYSYIKKLIFK